MEHMSQLLDTILLFSLPASGKSEVRRYLASLTPDQCRNDFHMGETLQLDDYPYVHLMHRIDDELQANGLPYAYYHGPNRPFINNWTWAVLIELLNEDYADLMASHQVEVASAAQHLFDRLDAAHAKVGIPQPMGEIPHRLRVRVAAALEAECRAELDTLNRQNAQDKTGRTLVIEAARGGANGSAELIPTEPAKQQERKREVRAMFAKRNESLAQRFRAKLTDFYGAEKAGSVKYVEAFEVCEYGNQPNPQELKKLFPFFGE